MHRPIDTASWHLSDWLSFYEKLHPVGIDMGLDRTAKVWQTLRQRHHIERIATQCIITVAGTNGKGSTCQMLADCFAGQLNQVGKYTSPHITVFNERIQINNNPVSDQLIIEQFQRIESARGDITLSYFEATTLAALLVFFFEQVECAILEVGLGGRLDAVNIIDADAVIITSIGVDHAEYLGENVVGIALEKAGVCRPNRPLVFAQTDIYPELIEYTQKQAIPLKANGIDYQITNQITSQITNQTLNQAVHLPNKSYPIPANLAALGAKQIDNAAAVITLLDWIGYLPEDYTDALAQFALAGRLQKIAQAPDIIIDVAHNADAANNLRRIIVQHRHRYSQCYAVIGMLADKDHAQVFAALDGCFDRVFLGDTPGTRGLSAKALAAIAAPYLTCPMASYTDLTAALAAAKAMATPDDVIYAFGSFTVASALMGHPDACPNSSP